MGKPKRQVLAAVEDTLTPPDTLQDNQSIVRVLKPEGNNLYTCLLPNKEKLVLELAQIFRNTIWVRRGGFVLADKYPEKSEETRAAGEIVNVVRDEKLWRKQAYWPKEFPQNPNGDSEDESNVGKMPSSDSESDNE